MRPVLPARLPDRLPARLPVLPACLVQFGVTYRVLTGQDWAGGRGLNGHGGAGALQLGIMALAMVIFVIINKTVLRRAAVFFSRDGELLFIGTMAYGLGAAGLCALAGASPMMGAYLAGLSLSFLPFQAQILEKIASLKVRLLRCAAAARRPRLPRLGFSAASSLKGHPHHNPHHNPHPHRTSRHARPPCARGRGPGGLAPHA